MVAHAIAKTTGIAIDFLIFRNTKVSERKVHVVVAGDTSGEVAQQYGIDLETLYQLNPRSNAEIYIGEELAISLERAYIQVNYNRTESVDYDIQYDVQKVKDNSMYVDESVVEQAGEIGSKTTQYNVHYISGVEQERTEISTTVTKEPVTKIVRVGTKARAGVAVGNFIWPVAGGYISSPFGMRWGVLHDGIDIAAPTGTYIYAADGGTVIFAGWKDGGYGNCVFIDHGNGFITRYYHCSSLARGIYTGGAVSQGQIIAYVGSTGNSTGPHCHFYMSYKGTAINPYPYVS